ncbi:hypothetical protein LEMLEM_LOCUS6847 [Lemmus lemmus]
MVLANAERCLELGNEASVRNVNEKSSTGLEGIDNTMAKHKEQELRTQAWALDRCVPCLTRGSRALVETAGAGLATGFVFWASPTAPASALRALEADTAARTAAAPGALCFLFLPPMFQLQESVLPDPDPDCHTTDAGERFTLAGSHASTQPPPSGLLGWGSSPIGLLRQAPPLGSRDPAARLGSLRHLALGF